MIEPDFDEDERCKKCYRPLQRIVASTTTNEKLELFNPDTGDWEDVDDFEGEYHHEEVTDEPTCSNCENLPDRCTCTPLKYNVRINVHGKEEFVEFEDE